MLRFAIIVFVGLAAAFAGWYVLEWGSVLSKYDASHATTTPNQSAASVYKNTNASDIYVTSPAPDSPVSDQMTIIGVARGNWFFEAVFPVFIEDRFGNVIGSGQAKAQADWTTAKLVPFTASIRLKNAYVGYAFVLLKKDNPSGDPSRDASLTIPVVIQ